MRVVLVTTKINLETAGGAVVDLHLKALSLVERGHEVTVVTANSKRNVLPASSPYKIAEEQMQSGRLIDLQRCAYAILKKYENQADVFYIDGHLFVYGAGLYRLLGGRVPVVAFFNIKLSGWPENYTGPNSTLRRSKQYLRFALERTLGVFIANRLDAFIFTTPTVAALYRKHGFDMRKSNILLDFAEGGLREFPIAQRERGRELPIQLFTSGRMIPEKGFDLLLRAVGLLPNSVKEKVHLTISGGGPESENLKALADELGITEKVNFPGWVSREELYQLMDASDVFIFPRWILEYSSVLLIEAMLRGMPAIVPKGGGIEWIAGDGGITFIDLDSKSLSQAIEKVVSHPGLLQSLAQKAALRSEGYRYQVLGGELERILLETKQKNRI